jgi:hypothetical protein
MFRSMTPCRRACVIAASGLLHLVSCRHADPSPELAPVALAPTNVEGTSRGFPEMRSLDGATIAKGEFAESADGDTLRMRTRYTFGTDHTTEEESTIRQGSTLVQETWSWRELLKGEIVRRFEIDFRRGEVLAEKREKGELRRWTEHFDLEPGRSFAGAGYSLALRSLRDRLLRGEKIELQGVGFTPKPKVGTAEVSFVGVERIAMSDRELDAEHFVIHAKIPWIARPFLHVPDSHIWLLTPPPSAFARFEGPLAETDDPIVRVDLLPGGASGGARPVRSDR